MDSKPKWPYRQLADGYNFVDAASTGFDGAVLMIPSSLTGFNQTAFGYVQDPNGGTTMCFGGILTSCGNAPCCPECGRRMHIRRSKQRKTVTDLQRSRKRRSLKRHKLSTTRSNPTVSLPSRRETSTSINAFPRHVNC